MPSLVSEFLFKWEILDYEAISQDLEESREKTEILLVLSLLLLDTPGCLDFSRSLREKDIMTHLL